MQPPETHNNAEASDVGPEVVAGLIGPIGVDLDVLTSELESAFRSVSYKNRSVSLIAPVLEYEPWDKTSTEPYDVRYNGRMDAGNQFREKLGRKDALALLAVTAIEQHRKAFKAPANPEDPASPIPRCAYLLRSLKTPDEVETLREIYGPNFLAIAAYMPRRLRKETLMRKIAQSYGDPEARRHESKAAALMARDEFELEDFGQNIRDTYPLADVFIDVSTRPVTSREAKRLVEVLFGHPFHTPRRAEAAMFHAYGAKLRSSSAGRQVGAAVVRRDGDVVAVGTNEVAKAHGGQYWSDEEDFYDQRDHRRDTDSTADMLAAIMKDLLVRLQRKGWLEETKRKLRLGELAHLAHKELLRRVPKGDRKADDPPTLGDKALLEKVIEYMRSVHAEMAALTTCARFGATVQGCDMYVTTFPCHECAKLIISSGIANVYFIEPYPKSRVAEMYDDSIVVDDIGDQHHVSFRAFTGIAPRRFVEWFEVPEPAGRSEFSEVKRRDENGSWVRWELVKGRRWPRNHNLPLVIMTREQDALEKFQERVAERGLKKPTEESGK
jgi:cytidine deaminase